MFSIVALVGFNRLFFPGVFCIVLPVFHETGEAFIGEALEVGIAFNLKAAVE
jgi:hypothetical protein